MAKPVLIVMAAGMGSRYGGLKQIDPVSDKGELITDFSLYDALMAGFERAVFIIKKEMESDMRALMDDGAGRRVTIDYAFQDIRSTPAWFALPEGREKPWGTGHAVLAAREVVDGPFAVINADDYYGAGAYQLMYEYLADCAGRSAERAYAMVGYRLENTVTEHGSVARGVCEVDGGFLTKIDERLKIERRDGGVAYEDAGGAWVQIPPDATVSMNFWGFTEDFMDELARGMDAFFRDDVPRNPLKSEYLLPRIVDKLLASGEAAVRVMESSDHWYGVTYKEDKPSVIAALQSLKDKGLYPEKLWR
jgi:NDP-sugar pyrophosphorylase family protein